MNMADERQKRGGDPGDAIREGMRAFAGVVGAFKEAIEQTFEDLSRSGDLSPERARESAGDAMRRMQQAFDEMRSRVDYVTRKEFDSLRHEVADLRAQFDRHATHVGQATQAGGASSGAPGGAGGTEDRPGTGSTGT
jgi:polyhydroxyalkanoate synthesis regulator phasin